MALLDCVKRTSRRPATYNKYEIVQSVRDEGISVDKASALVLFDRLVGSGLVAVFDGRHHVTNRGAMAWADTAAALRASGLAIMSCDFSNPI
jgi:hypothetical protein